MKLNLGAGIHRKDGFISIDLSPEYNPDIVADLNNPLPFDNDSIDEIYASHILEHIRNIIGLMNECYRVLKVGGIFDIIVPSILKPIYAFCDPTHVNFLCRESFDYYSDDNRYEWLQKSYGITSRFKIISFNYADDTQFLTIRLGK